MANFKTITEFFTLEFMFKLGLLRIGRSFNHMAQRARICDLASIHLPTLLHNFLYFELLLTRYYRRDQ